MQGATKEIKGINRLDPSHMAKKGTKIDLRLNVINTSWVHDINHSTVHGLYIITAHTALRKTKVVLTVKNIPPEVLRSTRPVVLIGGHVTGRDEGGLHVYVEQTLTSGTFIQSESHFDDGALVHIADLYAGLGVFSQQAKELHLKVAIGVESSAATAHVYTQLHDEPSLCDKVMSVRAKLALLRFAIHLLTAGFPRQPWSILGEGKGFDDARGEAITHILELYVLLQPRGICLECVPRVYYDKAFQKFLRAAADLLNLYLVQDVTNLSCCLPISSERWNAVLVDKRFECPVIQSFGGQRKMTFRDLNIPLHDDKIDPEELEELTLTAYEHYLYLNDELFP
jgi:hypothetical protein